LYVAIRYVASGILQLTCVHRGMFHSLPALVIAAEIAFLAYLNDSTAVRGLMAVGVALGFGSHLVLDEIYSVTWNGGRLQLKSSAGSATKLLGPSWPVNFVVFGIALTLGYAVLLDGGFTAPPAVQRPLTRATKTPAQNGWERVAGNPSHAPQTEAEESEAAAEDEADLALEPSRWQRTRR
jgi:hypothetical protein